MALLFTSDTHFGDHRAINIHKRPFGSVAEMDALLERRWNEAVAPEDEIWHLGDFAMRAADAEQLLDRLNGRKHLVRGNNDPDAVAALSGWASVQDYAEREVDGRKLVLCHYPFRTWNGQHRGALDLHGHSHGRLKPLPSQFDVGVDVWEWRPVPLARIIQGQLEPRALEP